MKKITYLLTAIFLTVFCWQGNAQLLAEDFTGQTIPTGWTNVDNGGGSTGGVWDFANLGLRTIDAPFDTDFAILDSDFFGSGNNQNATLTTVSFDASSGLPIYLSFDHQYRVCCGSTASVEVYDGTTWTPVYNLTSTSVGYPGTPDSQSIDITAATGGSAVAQVRFNYVGDWDYWWAIDNISIDEVTCAPPSDLSITVIDDVAGTADFNWTDTNGGSDNFNYTVDDITNGGVFTSGNTGGANTVQITGLIAGNDYAISISSVCGFETSAIAGPLSWTQVNLPDCISNPFPADGAVDVTGGFINFTWDEAITGGTPTGYEIFFGETSGSLSSLGVLPAPSTGVGIGPIDPGVTYYWMIVPQNGAGSAIGCAEYSFTTKATPNSPIAGVTCPGGDNLDLLTEEFDAIGLWTGDVGTGGTGGVWNFGEDGGTLSDDTGPDAAFSGTNYMYFEASTADFTTASAVSPSIDLTSATDGVELSFYMHAYGATMGALNVGVGTSAAGPFTNEFSWGGQLQTASTDAWEPVGIDLTSYIGQIIYIELSYTKTNSFTGDMSIDLLNVETCLTITCAAPTDLARTAVDSGAGTADFSWTDGNSPSDDFTYTVQDITNTVLFESDVTGGATNVQITGLTTGNEYTFEVYANCGGDTSSVTGPLAWTQLDPPTCIETPILPADGASDQDYGFTTLTWTEDTSGGEDPTGYQIWFGTTSGSLTLLGVVPAPATSQAISGILPSTTYYWMVVPENAGGEATGCAEYSYMTKDQFGGDDCASAEVITPGIITNTVIFDGTGGGTTGTRDAIWFSYTPAVDGTIDVISCLGGSDTTLWIWDGTCAALTAVDNAGDVCDRGDGNLWAASLYDVPVTAGTEYFIEWDDQFSEGPFTWELIFTPPPSCLEPVNLAAINLSPTNAELSWDIEAGALDGYRWEIQDFGVAQGDLGVIDSGTTPDQNSNSATSSGAFTAGNSYTLYVNSVCEDGVNESLYASIDFTVPLFNSPCTDTNAISSSPGTDIINTNPPTVDVITGSGIPGEILTDLRVYIGITHTYIGDLTITLTSPAGTSVDIFDGNCGTNEGIDVEFNDSGVALVCATPTAGIYLPDNPLSAFDGEFFDGDWTLTVTDGFGGDDGTLDQWCLIPTFDLVTTQGSCTGGDMFIWEDNGLGSGRWNDGVNIPGTTSPGTGDFAVINFLYNTGISGDLDVCALWILANHSIVVEDGDYVRTGDNNNLILGNLFVLNNGSFVQTGANARTIKAGAGFVDVQRITPSLNDYDFTIMGSPMDGETREGVYGGAHVVRNHLTGNFVPFANGTPAADNWADDNGDNWDPHTGDLIPGVGYLVKPTIAGGTGGAYTTNYTLGNLNSGDISFTPIINAGGPDESPNVLSNPYASALTITDFLTANTDAGSSLYFWEHLLAPNPGFPGYLAANYEMDDISSTNGVVAVPSASGGVPPTNHVPTGQGFGLKPTLATTITFTNAMRNIGPNDGYRNSELDVLQLSVANTTYGLKGYSAIGFSNANTDAMERFDVKRMGTSISLFSVVGENELGIQMRSAFNEDHIIPLGFHTFVEEEQTYTISIREIEGELLNNATVFLKDNLLNTVTNLSETDYEFTANLGYQTDRFVLVFESSVLGNEEVSLDAVSIYPIPAESLLTISSPLAKVNTVVITDISGRQVAAYNFADQNSYQIDVSNFGTAVYFVEINTDNGSVTKRMIKE